MHYKVVLEFELDAESLLDAAKKAKEVASTLDLVYVIEDENEIVYTVDLEENEELAVLKECCYIPLIKGALS